MKDAHLKVAVAGASGFVGKALVEDMKDDCRMIALSRSIRESSDADSSVEWRHCDLFSFRTVSKALQGVDCAIYLVHSMMPSAKLTQAGFEDLDLIAADNFARACRDAGVKQIVYLSGLMPEGETLSNHLKSRREVETALRAYGTPLTVLRAGLVVGPGGSSTSMLFQLVHRLPVMVCP